MELFTPGHLIVIAIVALVLFFGWKQLPDMARSVGRSLRVFKTEIKGMGQDDKDRADAEAKADETPRGDAARPEIPRADVLRRELPATATDTPRESRSAEPAASGRPRPTPRPRA